MTIELIQDGKEEYYVSSKAHIPQELASQLENRVVQSKAGNFYYLSNSNQYYLTRNILINSLNQSMTKLIGVLDMDMDNSEEVIEIKNRNRNKLISQIDELVSEIERGTIHLPELDQITLNYLLHEFKHLKDATLSENSTKLKQANNGIYELYQRTKSRPEENETDAVTLIELLQK